MHVEARAISRWKRWKITAEINRSCLLENQLAPRNRIARVVCPRDTLTSVCEFTTYAIFLSSFPRARARAGLFRSFRNADLLFLRSSLRKFSRRNWYARLRCFPLTATASPRVLARIESRQRFVLFFFFYCASESLNGRSRQRSDIWFGDSLILRFIVLL